MDVESVADLQKVETAAIRKRDVPLVALLGDFGGLVRDCRYPPLRLPSDDTLPISSPPLNSRLDSSLIVGDYKRTWFNVNFPDGVAKSPTDFSVDLTAACRRGPPLSHHRHAPPTLPSDP